MKKFTESRVDDPVYLNELKRKSKKSTIFHEKVERSLWNKNGIESFYTSKIWLTSVVCAFRRWNKLSLSLSLYSIQASIPLDCTYPRCVSRRGRERERERESGGEKVGGETIEGVKGSTVRKRGGERTGGWRNRGETAVHMCKGNNVAEGSAMLAQIQTQI